MSGNKGGRPPGCKHYIPKIASRTHPKLPKTPPQNDPPAIVMCSTCHESVLGLKGKYWDIEELFGVGLANKLHRHQPAKARYGDDGYTTHKPRSGER